MGPACAAGLAGACACGGFRDPYWSVCRRVSGRSGGVGAAAFSGSALVGLPAMAGRAADAGSKAEVAVSPRLEMAMASGLAELRRRAWLVRSSRPLEGEVVVAGAKNTITKLMIASCLASGTSELGNVPEIADTTITAAMLEAVGAGVAVESGWATIDGAPLNSARVGVAYSGLNRMPILALPVLLHRFGEAHVPVVGGDGIGLRPVDFHRDALVAMGVEVVVGSDGISAYGEPVGADIGLPYPSVGATETVLLAAVLARGRTVLRNAAVEPEVQELALFLQRMGAVIELADKRSFIIDGVGELSPARQFTQGDRTEAFSYLVAGIATGGRVAVVGVDPARMSPAVALLRRMGADVRLGDDRIEAEAPGGLSPVAVSTAPYPGVATDWQPPLVAALTQAEGVSAVHETVFEDRLGYTEQLRAMGATIEAYNDCLGGGECRFETGRHRHSALVAGPAKLHGAEVAMADIRAGFGLAVASVMAAGESLLSGIHHLERGYDRVLEKFTGLGADIEATQT